jgi:UDP-glucose 4-epimerase
VLHLAWSSVPVSAEQEPRFSHDGDLELLTSLLQNSTPGVTAAEGPLFVFFSSCSVYGEPPPLRTSPFGEHDKPQPIGKYAMAKLTAERIIEDARQSGTRALVLRVSNPFGFRQPSRRPQGIIPAALDAALAGRTFEIWGDGTAEKDFLDVRDLCTAVARSLEMNLTGVFNVCSGKNWPINEVLDLIEQLAKKSLSRLYRPSAPWDVRTACYSNAKFCSLTGWKPAIPFETGLADYIQSADRKKLPARTS